MDISKIFADFIVEAEYGKLPSAAVRVAKRLILDTIAVSWAGSTAPGVIPLYRFLAEQGGRPESSVWTFGGRLPCTSAAMINGVLGAALDYDSLHLGAVVHSSIVIQPALFALAERQHSSGRDFVTAFVVGNELTCRLGLSAPNHTGWFYTSIHGVFGAAAACARLLHLTPLQARHALGVALSHVGGTQQAIVERALTKRMQSAFAARAGLFAALLAERDFTAPLDTFEGQFGFYSLYEHGTPETALDALGTCYEMANTSLKKYPSCACNHAVIEAALNIREQHMPKLSDITDVEVRISPFMNRLVGAPYDPTANPQIAAQFSAQYSVASALIRGHVNISDIDQNAALDPEIKAFAHNIRVVVDEANTGRLYPAAVSVRLSCGLVLKQIITRFPGSPENPISDEDLHNKVLECLSLGNAPLSTRQAENLIAKVNDIEAIDDMSDFMAEFAVPNGNRVSVTA